MRLPSVKLRHEVQLLVSNRSASPKDMVLEPRGEIYTLDPGAERTVTYRGDSKAQLAIDVGDGEVKLWAEGGGRLAVFGESETP